MKTSSLFGILVSFGVLSFVSCQKELTVLNESPLTSVTKSGDSDKITSQNGGSALVTEGYTVNPVYFIVSFNEPQGGTITLVDQVY